MDVAFEILHAVPGRVRLRVPDIKENASFAQSVTERLLRKPGVTYVRANPICASVVVGYDTSVIETFIPETSLRGLKIRRTSERSYEVTPADGNGHNGHTHGLLGVLHRLRCLLLPTVALITSLATRALPIAPVYALVAAATVPVFSRALGTLAREKRFGVDFLDATAIAIMGVQRNLPTCAFMAWLIRIGDHIRDETAHKSERAIADLLRFHGDTAIVIRGRRRIRVPVDSLIEGDVVSVSPGDMIPVDGIVVSGAAGIDQASLTGESVLQEKVAGDKVYAGSVAVDGELIISARAVGLETRIGKIVQMLRSMPAQETRIEDHAARFADGLVLPTFAFSGIILALTRNMSRALSILIVDFGTGVRVAAPTAFLSYMASAAHKNIVIKGGRAMERLASVDTVIFDKTGTLSTGFPEVRDVVAMNGRYTESGVLRLAAAAESGLTHPVANAICARAKELGLRLPRRIDSRLLVGMGIKATIGGHEALIGSSRLMKDESIDTSPAHNHVEKWLGEAKSPIFVAVDHKLVGLISYSDKMRAESCEVVADLRGLGVRRVIILTGDREEVARVAAEDLGISEYAAGVFPERKLELLKELQKAGHVVAVVGDGVNDTLALAQADVAVAPFGATDAAKEAADVLLMEDDLSLLIEAFETAKSAIALVRQNYGIVAVPNAGAIALAAGGLLGPAGATFINNGSTVAAGLNSLRPLLTNGKRKGSPKRASCVLGGAETGNIVAS